MTGDQSRILNSHFGKGKRASLRACRLAQIV
jgi:hypothetical protein